MNATAIGIRGVTKSFGTHLALDNIDLDVRPGELLALLGPSGSGKTSLLRIIAGLEAPDSGQVLFGAEDASGRHPGERQVGFVFQHYALFRHMTVFENIAFGMRVVPRARRLPRTVITERVTRLLDLVQLGWLADRYPAQLSGGQRQRVALARALAIEPKVLLLDEPFGALDAVVRSELRQWLKELHHQLNVTTVLVTHDQQEAMEVADQLIVMRTGKVIQSGHPLSLYESPATNFVHEFLGPSTNFEGVVTRPHDLELVAVHQADVKGRITKIVSLGFEAQVTVELTDGTTTWVQLSRNEISTMGLRVALLVGVRRRDLDA
jgi:sulfate transport system ATP-binding protein